MKPAGRLLLPAAVLLAWGITAAAAPAAQTLHVFAAASLAGAFGEIARDFERTHLGTRVRLNLAGSQQLAMQIEQGAAAEVFASADEPWMTYLADRSRLEGEPAQFARNRLAVIVPRTNPARIAGLRDLARRGVKLVIGAEAVPVGRYSREMLGTLANTPGFAPDFARRTLANVVSEEENVRLVVGKVQIGEADAGICYRSDVTDALSRFVRVFEIPEAAQVTATYPIAAIAGTARPVLARQFVAHVLSAEGQRVLERHGLLPAAVTVP
ncbi:MAG: molybdate ABC transporter substrate-binding protein [Candidatus Eisenbacteria bacterium]